MLKTIMAGTAGATLAALATTAMAASPLDGTWKTDIASVQVPKRPDVSVLTNGVYDCKSCLPPYQVKADGAFHAVAGHPNTDEIAIKVVDARTVEETDRKAGRVVGRSTMTASPDGKTLAVEFSDTTNAGAPPITGKTMSTRVADTPKGAHATSGSWQATVSNAAISDSGLQITFKVDGDVLKMSTPSGQSYSAKLDGSEAPFKGDPGTTSVSVKGVNAHEVLETDKRDGKVIATYRMTVAPDGKSMTTVVENKRAGTTTTFKANKV